MPTTERELTAPVDLCGADGRLNPAAVGWSRTPLHRANLRGWGRAKRWEYWGIVTPTHVLGVTVSSLDYAALYSLYVLDRATGREIERADTVPLATGVVLPERTGTASGRGRTLAFEFGGTPAATTLKGRAPDIDFDLTVQRDPGHEALAVVVPWSPKRFQYTVKDVALPVIGQLLIAGVEVPVGEGSFAVLDSGRGKWPRSITWNWAAGSAPGGRGLTVGGTWTDGTGSTENGVLVDGRLHKIGEELRWDYDRTDWMRPWRIHGATVDVTLHPFHERSAATDMKIIASETHQCFGEFTGWATTEDGERVGVDGLVGWAEEARQLW
ncbi:Protein of unknown function [Blastococcus aggregatus]|uniref:DUF2804 domain-containing protein n=1 Tax=Blastococcus aggregatus TaxID=38502 RepID=A0A285VID7_9ACTN|nr:DUF2804 domain-containing protein [Blastococcus aggregatus]SOC52311.1 Protein of unknown function [Blastococcus aggregatus]